MSNDHNHNPTGKNQHGRQIDKEDPILVNALQVYHRERLTNNKEIAARLSVEHRINISATSVGRLRRHHKLLGAAANLASIPQIEAEQMVLQQLELDPAGRAGPRVITHRLASREGQHLPRDFVTKVMKTHAAEGFEKRNPGAKKLIRVKKVPIGIHERWSCDGHDKLYKIGFPVYGFVDDGTGRWLAGWVVPSNRFGHIIGYLFLCCVEKYGGIPLQLSTDCGSETTLLYGLVNALREIFHPDFDPQELPAHVYLRSVHNISIERAWLRLRLEWGDNAVAAFEKGEAEGWYQPHNRQHKELCQWLWAKLLRQSLAVFINERNSYPSRKDSDKAGPSGCSSNAAFFMPERWGGRDCLLKVDVGVIREIKEALGGDEILEFVPREFRERAEAAYLLLGVQNLTFKNVWQLLNVLDVASHGMGLAKIVRSARLVLTSIAIQILDLAHERRGEASDTRFTAGPPKTVGSTSSSNRHNNVNKANEVNAERRARKAEANLREAETGITVGASLWYFARGNQALVKPHVQVQQTFKENKDVKSCFDTLLKLAKNEYERIIQGSVNLHGEIHWGNILTYAHRGSTNKYSSLGHINQTQTIGALFMDFKAQKYASESLLRTRTIEIRFVIRDDCNNDDLESSSAPTSKRKRGLSTASSASAASAKSARTEGPGPALSAIKGSAVIRKSAYRRPDLGPQVPQPTISTRWTRNPPMVEYTFRRTVAHIGEDGNVNLVLSNEDESILLAKDWEEGEKAAIAKTPFDTTGFIARGGTKRAIYARFNGKEYVFAQNFDDFTTPDEVRKNLSGEYELLSQCHWFKEKFDTHAMEMNVISMPDFYFNFPGSILGEIQSPPGSGRIVPFRHFLATPLLPCGEVDPPIRKFTGNDSLGPANDPYTQAIHAFTHFSYIYSCEYIFFCDLQGTRDVKGRMCLFDPQAHTNQMLSSGNNHQYWNLGAKMCTKLREEHLAACDNNPFCRQLQLLSIEFDGKSAIKSALKSKKPSSRDGWDDEEVTSQDRMRVGALLNASG